MSSRSFFNKKFAIVTGGSEGIGLAIATGLAALCANVLVCSRDSDKLARAMEKLEKVRTSPEQRLTSASIDVTDFDSTRRELKLITSRHGAPDLLINSAGFAHPGYMEDLDMTAFHRMMDVNYFGTVHTVKALLPAMKEAGRGHIVNVSSMAGYLGLFGYTGYCASKYAVIGFSWALRHEIRPHGIAVSVLCPPNTRTPGLNRENQIKPQEILAMEERAGTLNAEDVASAMIRAIPNRPFMINPNLRTRLTYLASRLAPTWIADSVLRRPVLK